MEPKKKRTSVEWSAPEHEHLEKDLGWYFFVGMAALVLVIIAFWKSDFFFAVFLILAAGLLMVFGSKEPEIYEFKIDSKGVTVGKKVYHYETLSDFSIRMRAGIPREIVIRKKSSMNPFMHLPAERHIIANAREILETRLPETEFNETFVDIFADFLGF